MHSRAGLLFTVPSALNLRFYVSLNQPYGQNRLLEKARLGKMVLRKMF
jgi:hypothetical protein